MVLFSFEQQTHKAIGNYFRRLLDCVEPEQMPRVERVLMQAGLSREALLAGGSQQVLFGDFKRVLYTIQDEVIPDIILRFSSSIRLSDLGLLGYTVINSETTAQALEVYTRFARLSYSNFEFQVYRDVDRAVIRPIDYPSSRLEREDFITSKYNMLSRILPKTTDFSRMRVEVDYAAPAYIDSYHEFFRCAVNFDAEQLSISFPEEWLQTSVNSADHDLYLLCESQCEEMLQEQGEAGAIVEKVRRIMLQPGATGVGLHLEQAAAILRMSTRNLREHIYKAGTTYKQIATDVRMSLAKQYLLGSKMSVKEIAYRLNYSQPNSFGRAFKRTFGVPPEELRRRSN